VLETCVFSVSS